MIIINIMRYLCFDYGLKRIGVALSGNTYIAFPAGVIINRSSNAVLKDIVKKVKKERINVIVVGLPIWPGGKETTQTTITRRFIALLKKNVSIPIETENEMLTSRIAIASGMKDDHIDASSAAIILQSYLDKKLSKIKKT